MNTVFLLGFWLLDVLLRLLLHSLQASVHLRRNVNCTDGGVLNFQVLSLFGISVCFFVIGQLLLVVIPSPVLTVAMVACPTWGVRDLASLVEFLVVPVVFGATLLMICMLLRLVPTRKSLLSPRNSKKVISSPFSAWSLLINTSVPPDWPLVGRLCGSPYYRRGANFLISNTISYLNLSATGISQLKVFMNS